MSRTTRPFPYQPKNPKVKVVPGTGMLYVSFDTGRGMKKIRAIVLDIDEYELDGHEEGRDEYCVHDYPIAVSKKPPKINPATGQYTFNSVHVERFPGMIGRDKSSYDVFGEISSSRPQSDGTTRYFVDVENRHRGLDRWIITAPSVET